MVMQNDKRERRRLDAGRKTETVRWWRDDLRRAGRMPIG